MYEIALLFWTTFISLGDMFIQIGEVLCSPEETDIPDKHQMKSSCANFVSLQTPGIRIRENMLLKMCYSTIPFQIQLEETQLLYSLGCKESEP